MIVVGTHGDLVANKSELNDNLQLINTLYGSLSHKVEGMCVCVCLSVCLSVLQFFVCLGDCSVRICYYHTLIQITLHTTSYPYTLLRSHDLYCLRISTDNGQYGG